MFSTTDTIVAIATPPGRGGIGVVRLSGPGAPAIARKLAARGEAFSARHATLASIHSLTGDLIDRAVVIYYPAPASYTGDDVVEVSAHGSPVVLKAIVGAAMHYGARLAEPGEFTLRAFLNSRIDLMQAEAVADLVEAATPLQARTAFDQLNGTLTRAIESIDAPLFDLIARLEASVDFPEEGYHFVEPGALAAAIDDVVSRTRDLLASARQGRLVREGLQVAIVGRPNAGKSRLFNALVGSARAIVTEVPGTTRDLVTERIDLHGLSVTLIDTAGLRDTDDLVESEGVARSYGAAAVADLVLLVVDVSEPPIDESLLRRAGPKHVLIVGSKADLPHAWTRDGAIEVSAATGAGLDLLRSRIVGALDVEPLVDRPEISNVRHIALLERTEAALARARTAALAGGRSMPEEFVLADLQEARATLEEIVGRRTSEDVLAHIFERFCIGK